MSPDPLAGPTETEAVARRLRAESATHHPDPAHILVLVRAKMRAEARPSRRKFPSWATPVGVAIGVAAVIVAAALVVPQPAAKESPEPSGPARGITAELVSGADTLVKLGDEGTLDWLVTVPTEKTTTGYRRDIVGQSLGSLSPEGSTRFKVGPGPFNVRWNGGRAPFATGSSNGLQTLARAPASGAGAGYSIGLRSNPTGRDLVLYAGVSGATARLSLVVAGRTIATQKLAPTGDPDTEGLRIIIPLDEVPTGANLVVKMVAAPGGTVSCAAVVLR